MHVSHLTSGYIDRETNEICLTFYCQVGCEYKTVDVNVRNESGYPFASQCMYYTDEYGDTVCKHYVASELRQAVNSMFRNDNEIIEACKSETGFAYREM